MKKKLEKVVKSAKPKKAKLTPGVRVGGEVCTKPLMSELMLDTGREDLNTMVVKINEIIKTLNKC